MAVSKKKTDKNAMAIINEHLKRGAFAPVYLLYGDCSYLVNQYRDKLLAAVRDPADTMNFARFTGDKIDPMELIGFCETLPFFAERRVVLAEDTGLFKKSCEAFAERLPELPDTSLIVFVEHEVDKRNKLYKTVDKLGEALCFETPDEHTLLVWVRSMFRTEDRAADDNALHTLIEHTGADMNMIKNEVDKLVSYTAGRTQITQADIDALCSSHVEGHIFDMVDAIAKHEQQRALQLYHDLMENREPAMRILFLITRQYDLLVKTKLCMNDGKNYADMASLLGVPSWSVKKYAAQCAAYSEAELSRILSLCQETDYKIKTGQAMDAIAVELLIILLSKQKER